MHNLHTAKAILQWLSSVYDRMLLLYVNWHTLATVAQKMVIYIYIVQNPGGIS